MHSSTTVVRPYLNIFTYLYTSTCIDRALAIAQPALLVALPCLLGPVLVQVRTGHKKRERRFWCLSIYLHGCSRPVGGTHTHTTTNTKQKKNKQTNQSQAWRAGHLHLLWAGGFDDSPSTIMPMPLAEAAAAGMGKGGGGRRGLGSSHGSSSSSMGVTTTTTVAAAGVGDPKAIPGGCFPSSTDLLLLIV